jgi:hypothetical protein
LILPAAVMADTFTDDFESYTAGTFPSANWQDAGTVAPEGTPPNPSVTVGMTTNAFGQPTQALHLDDSWVGASSGVFRSVATASHYRLSMDVRTDRFAHDAQNDPSDWPWALMVAKYTDVIHPGAWNSLGLYGAGVSQEFKAYAIRADGFEEDIPLGLPLALGEWYRVQMDVDAEVGAIRNRVWDIDDNTLLLDATVTATGWLPTDGIFDAVTINQGERSATSSGDAWVDNVLIRAIPEPSATTAVLLGSLLLVGLRRRFSRL